MSEERQDSVFPSHACAHDSCFCNHLSFQLSQDLLVRLSMLKEQTAAGLLSGCGLRRTLQTQSSSD